MEKLIMLIDIYEEEVVGVHSVGEKITEKEEARIISKKFGFIKWLVENEKIDLGEKIFNLTKDDNKLSMVVDLDEGCFSWEETLLMLLSIQDEPIEFLVSILK